MNAQTDFNMELLKNVDFGDGGSGCWGHTDKNGIEYAVIGTRTAIRILSLEDPKNPIERLSIPGNNTSWREARSWGDFIYVTTESQDGITIIDASKAPAEFTWKRWKPAVPNTSDTIRTVHSIYNDTLGYLYINGHNVSPRGVIICDLNQDPYNPTIVANAGTVYTHDCFATDKTLFTCDLSNGVGVYDITDRSNPKFITRFATTSNFTHNAWDSKDGKFLYTTDERLGAYVDVYDISDLNNIKFITKYRNDDSELGKVIPHNVYTLNNYAVTAWYTDGVLITDMTRPDNIVKVGSFDTYFKDLPGSGFLGVWGVYPYFKSGTIVASDLETGLWIMKPTYKRASYLEGGAYAVQKGNRMQTPIQNAEIKILALRSAKSSTDQSGIYKTGIAEAGTYLVTFSHPDYESDTIELELKEGEVTNFDFIIESQFITGKITDENGNSIKGVIDLKNNSSASQTEIYTDENGNFSFPARESTSYSISAAAWGYKSKSVEITSINDFTISLEKGYEDDFFADLGWKLTKLTVSGNWERVKPKGTNLNGVPSNPGEDVADDIGDKAYVTGNGGNQPGDNDVDSGNSLLESPAMDFSGFDSVQIDYFKWFFNGGGSGDPNDDFTISLSNGTETIELEKVENNTLSWEASSLKLSKNELPFTNSMKLIFDAIDRQPGHLVEAGLDKLRVNLFSKSTTGINEPLSDNFYLINNISSGSISLFSNFKSTCPIQIYDVKGLLIEDRKIESGITQIDVSAYTDGMYFLIVEGEEKKVFKFVKI